MRHAPGVWHSHCSSAHILLAHCLFQSASLLYCRPHAPVLEAPPHQSGPPRPSLGERPQAISFSGGVASSRAPNAGSYGRGRGPESAGRGRGRKQTPSSFGMGGAPPANMLTGQMQHQQPSLQPPHPPGAMAPPSKAALLASASAERLRQGLAQRSYHLQAQVNASIHDVRLL